MTPLQRRDDVGRHPLVYLHRRLAHREVVAREGGELHRVLEEAGPGGKARPREVGGPGIVAADRVEDVRVIHAGLVGDHEELVGDRELHVAPGVGEELGELGLLGARPDDLAPEPGEESSGAIADRRIVGADDLGQSPELLESVALGDPLRTECHPHLPAAIREGLRDVGSGPGVDRAAEHHERPVAEVRRHALHGLLEQRHRRAQELVHGRPDDDDEDAGPADERRRGRQDQAPSRQNLRQQPVRAVLTERHLAPPDAIQGHLVRVEDTHPETACSEGEAEGQAHVAATAQDDDVEVRVAHGRRG